MPFEIKHPITGGILQVADNDFPSKMNWNDAISACQNLGNDWRLPSLEELTAMHEQLHKQGKGNFKDESYWSNSEYDADDAWSFYFFDGQAYYDSGLYNGKTLLSRQVRAVREF